MQRCVHRRKKGSEGGKERGARELLIFFPTECISLSTERGDGNEGSLTAMAKGAIFGASSSSCEKGPPHSFLAIVHKGEGENDGDYLEK